MLKHLSRKLGRKLTHGAKRPRRHDSRPPNWVVLAEAGQVKQLLPLAMLITTSEAMLIVVGKRPDVFVDDASWQHVERVKLPKGIRADTAMSALGYALGRMFESMPSLQDANWILLNADRVIQRRIAKLVFMEGGRRIVKVKGGGLSVFDEDVSAQAVSELETVSTPLGRGQEQHVSSQAPRNNPSALLEEASEAGSDSKIQEQTIWLAAIKLGLSPPYSEADCTKILDMLLDSGIDTGGIHHTSTPFLMAGYHQRAVVTGWSAPNNHSMARDGDTISRLLSAKGIRYPIPLLNVLSVLRHQEQRRWETIGVEIPVPPPRSKECSWTGLAATGSHHLAMQALRKVGFAAELHVAPPSCWKVEHRKGVDLKEWPEKPYLPMHLPLGHPFLQPANAEEIDIPYRYDELAILLERVHPSDAKRLGLPPALRRERDEQALMKAANLIRRIMLTSWRPGTRHEDCGAILNAIIITSGFGYPILLDQLLVFLRQEGKDGLATRFWNFGRCGQIDLWDQSDTSALTDLGFSFEWVYTPAPLAG